MLEMKRRVGYWSVARPTASTPQDPVQSPWRRGTFQLRVLKASANRFQGLHGNPPRNARHRQVGGLPPLGKGSHRVLEMALKKVSRIGKVRLDYLADRVQNPGPLEAYVFVSLPSVDRKCLNGKAKTFGSITAHEKGKPKVCAQL